MLVHGIAFPLIDLQHKETNPEGGATAYRYDANDNLLSLTDPLLKVERYEEYDGRDNLLRITDRKGQVTTSTYDPLDCLKTRTFHDSSTITYTYPA